MWTDLPEPRRRGTHSMERLQESLPQAGATTYCVKDTVSEAVLPSWFFIYYHRGSLMPQYIRNTPPNNTVNQSVCSIQ